MRFKLSLFCFRIVSQASRYNGIASDRPSLLGPDFFTVSHGLSSGIDVRHYGAGSCDTFGAIRSCAFITMQMDGGGGVHSRFPLLKLKL